MTPTQVILSKNIIDNIKIGKKLNITLTPIATICSPFCELVNMPVQPKGAKETYATIEFKNEFMEGLKDLDGFSHVYLIYYFQGKRAKTKCYSF
jgi:tRNA (Thr-GGU) A37 N-methylase